MVVGASSLPVPAPTACSGVEKRVDMLAYGGCACTDEMNGYSLTTRFLP